MLPIFYCHPQPIGREILVHFIGASISGILALLISFLVQVYFRKKDSLEKIRKNQKQIFNILELAYYWCDILLSISDLYRKKHVIDEKTYYAYLKNEIIKSYRLIPGSVVKKMESIVDSLVPFINEEMIDLEFFSTLNEVWLQSNEVFEAIKEYQNNENEQCLVKIKDCTHNCISMIIMFYRDSFQKNLPFKNKIRWNKTVNCIFEEMVENNSSFVLTGTKMSPKNWEKYLNGEMSYIDFNKADFKVEKTKDGKIRITNIGFAVGTIRDISFLKDVTSNDYTSLLPGRFGIFGPADHYRDVSQVTIEWQDRRKEIQKRPFIVK